MTELRTEPLDGIPAVFDTRDGLHTAARTLAAGHGPIAIDTERASAYRYDDRAFLLQLRRAGSGTVLIDPEGRRDDVRNLIGPVVNGADWVLHAAPSDLPSLARVGLYPGRLFDTELAARMAGFSHPNLGAMVEELLGVQLEKGYGDADWSTRPLPREWLAYAALDVELLIELAEILRDILAERDKYDWAQQEFAAIARAHADSTGLQTPSWRDTKGIKTLRRAEQLAVARALWTARDKYSRGCDRAPGKVLPNKVLIDIARRLPATRRELEGIKGFPRRRPGAAAAWFQVIREARALPRDEWPRPQRAAARVPSKTTWAKDHPDEWLAYQDVRADVEELARELDIAKDTVIRPAALRAAVWAVVGTPPHGAGSASPSIGGTVRQVDGIPDVLAAEGARPWQIELVKPVIARRLFGDAGTSTR